jgi:hypothetical protein
MPLREGLLRFLSFPSRFQVYGLKITPHFWPGMCPPVVVELKPGTTPISQKQYFIPHKAQVRIQKHLDRLLKYRILQPCHSCWNSPLLPIQKQGTKDFRPVQDL